MKLSILLVSYNTKKLTLKAVRSVSQSLPKSSLSYELLVLDNNSSDGSYQALCQIKSPSLKIFQAKTNLGFGKANNFLAKAAKGQYLLFLNSDTEVLNEAITKLLHCYRKNHFAFLGAKLLNPNLTPQPSCGPLYNPVVVFAALFLRGDYYGLTRYSPNKLRSVGWVSGACFLTTAKYFRQVNGFDNHIFMYMEEIDLFKRAQTLGLKVGFCHSARIIHHGFATSGSKSRPVINVYKGLLFYYQKHYGRFFQLYLRLLLKTKAIIGYTLGVCFRSKYLKKTYDEAYQTTL